MTDRLSWIALLPLAAASIIDLRTGEIPNWIPVSILVVGVALAARGGPAGWISTGVGFAVGSALGLLLFWRAGFGGGDVKLLASLGAVIGWPDLTTLLFYIAVAGGGLALVAAARRQREFAYAPAFAIGLLLFLMMHAKP